MLPKSVPLKCGSIRLPFSLRSLFQPSLLACIPLPTLLGYMNKCEDSAHHFHFLIPLLHHVTWLPAPPNSWKLLCAQSPTCQPQKTITTFPLPFKPPLPLGSETPFCPGFPSFPFDYSSFAHSLNVHSSLALFPFHSILQLLKICFWA